VALGGRRLQQIYLNFHGLGTPPAHVADEERPYWLAPEHFAAILQLAQESETGDRKVSITFDDGNRSDVTVALPILQKFHRSASFFLLSDRISRPGFLEASDIVRLRDAGMAIGSHGAAHVDWTTLSDSELLRQVTNSLQVLTGYVGMPITIVAVPFGHYDRRVLKLLRTLGTTAVYTSDGGAVRPNNWIRPRTTIRADTSLEMIEALISDRLPPLQRLRFFYRRLRSRAYAGDISIL
jgi:peptidoglycan/xylan/chitin deacetylase (PgdA/CDA1 family)